eukprot:scaffold155079_cov39-Tisochrysis_lutea.AAC.1
MWEESNISPAPHLNLEREDLSDTELSLPSWPVSQRPLPRPHHFDTDGTVVCLGYAQQSSRDHRREEYAAQLCYYLPEGWSASYKFTVFEKSYIVLIRDGNIERFGLARPVHPTLSTTAGRYVPGLSASSRNEGLHGGELELVWPMPLDMSILDAARKACDGRQHAKRKIAAGRDSELGIRSVNHKLRKLSV